MKDLIDKLKADRILTKSDFIELIEQHSDEDREYLSAQARQAAHKVFSNKIYIRGLIEFTNYCKNDCYYCGIRKSNRAAERYRLTKDEILTSCRFGYDLGFRTFVLQGGEDPYYTDKKLIDIISSIRSLYPDCAITLSIGVKTRAQYQAYFDAGADRFLLRHETAKAEHFSSLHPANLSLEERQRALYDLKSIGYQAGTGFMVASPGQTADSLADDLLFISKLKPEMVGMGPFVPHHDTIYADCPAGTVEETVFLISILRLLLPHTLIPATTALATIDAYGRERGILAGANVIMPNLSPASVRKKYSLYDNKAFSNEEAAENVEELKRRMQEIGYEIVVDRGDYKDIAEDK